MPSGDDSKKYFIFNKKLIVSQNKPSYTFYGIIDRGRNNNMDYLISISHYYGSR